MIDRKRVANIRRASKLTIMVGLVAFLALIGYSGYQLYSINKQIAGKNREIRDAAEKSGSCLSK